MMKLILTYILVFLFTGLIEAQVSEYPERTFITNHTGITSDSLYTVGDSLLTYDTYLLWVAAFHPVARSANLEVDFAESMLTMSRGGFDPQLYGNYRNKEFKEDDYYTMLQAGVEIPTWFGLSIQGGYEDNQGLFLNPEASVPSRGLFHAGISAQLGAGLLMDSRRAALRQAELGLELGLIDQRLMLNQLYFEATRAYYTWANAERGLEIAEEALDLSLVRFDGVRESFIFGDVPAIDTVEAYTQVLMRLYLLRDAQSRWVEAINFANIYLWDTDGNVVNLPPGVKPIWEEISDARLSELPLKIPSDHPELRKLITTRAQLDFDRRLSAEYLRPVIELKYNMISENIGAAPIDDYVRDIAFFENNYTFGAKVSFPLLVREARGKLGMTKVKMEMVDQKFLENSAKLDAKLDALLVKLANLRDQINFYRSNVELLRTLLEAEQTLFGMGESSLFIVNARETKLIESQNILNDLVLKSQVLYAEIRVVGGDGFLLDN
jgi:outer membrane protein TolC